MITTRKTYEFGAEGADFIYPDSARGFCLFRPDLVFHPQRIIPRDVTFWNDFTIESVRIGNCYQGPKAWKGRLEERRAGYAPCAARQVELDAFAFEVMVPNMDLLVAVLSLRSGVRCKGFAVEGSAVYEVVV
jgi:hypothetical protein